MAARRTQQGRGLKQVVVRFNVEQDAALLEWLAPFANTYDMTKVIRLACYALAGLQPEEGLLALLPDVKKRQNGSGARVGQRPPASEIPHNALADVMQELAALRATVLEQQFSTSEAHRSLSRAEWKYEYREREPGAVMGSSGLDVTSRRGNPRARAVDQDAPPRAALDPHNAQQSLLMAIRQFSQNRSATRG